MSTPEPTPVRLDAAGRRRVGRVVPAIVLAGGLLFAGIGVALVVSVNPLIGVIFIAVGLADAVMGLLFLGAFGAGASRGQPAAVEQGEPVTPEMDPSYNPYARED